MGNCRCCGETNVMVRHIPLYVFGSEGLLICEPCDQGLAEAAREYIHVRHAEREEREGAMLVEAKNWLPIVNLNGKTYYIDNKLEQVRAVDNPSDFMSFVDMTTDALQACSEAFIAWRDALSSSSVPTEGLDP